MAKHAAKAAPSLWKNILLWTARVLVSILTFVLVLAVTLFVSLDMICGDTSPKAKQTFVTTILETGQLKFLASWFLSPEEIQAVVDSNSMDKMDETIDSGLVTIDPDASDEQDIEIIKIPGRTFEATLMKVKDPSRISLASIYPWRQLGITLDEFVKENDAVAGINGGLYASSNNTGGRPYGVVVSNGEIQLNEPNQFKGLVLIGFTEDNLLEIISVEGMSKQEVKEMIETKKIRDAVTFQEESSDANNHFVQLVINGKPRGMNGMGSGLNPRTAIGQCADGSVLLLVTDGRGKSGHLGASASDLIDIMMEYGAVNAANLDGGSSSCMYYEDEYLMTSVTFYYSNDSWRMPVAFIVK
ncbi:MAG: phosphodiester glycosidase family protein [Clostridia bacterium]|nr:phosphodiester glycosidase family protein [Clostridia bacterium]